MTHGYEKISPTAILVAAIRAKYTDLPYAKEIYTAVQRINKPHLFRRAIPLISSFGRLFPRSTSRLVFLEARYLTVNRVLKDIGDSYAVVEIASGLSSRGLEWANHNSIYIETDLPDMLRTKQEIVSEVMSKSGIPPNSQHHFYPLNAMDYDDWDRLGRKFFEGKKPSIAVVHEGLARYLSGREKDLLRDNIARFLKTYAAAAVWITPDFYPYNYRHRTPITRFVEKHIERKTGRRYHHFSSEQEVRDFLLRGGFTASFVSDSLIFDQLTCLARLHVNREKTYSIVKNFRVSLATLS